MTRKVLVSLSDQFLRELDALVESGECESRSDAVRLAVRQFLERKKLEQLDRKIREGRR